MKRWKTGLWAAAVIVVAGQAVTASVIVDTLGTNDRANLSIDAGQTFTTGVLGAENRLASIEIQGPRDDGGANGFPLGPFVLEVYINNDVDTVWDPGALLVGGTSNSGSLIVGDTTFNSGGVTTFSFNSLPTLADNTVYAFTYTDGLGTRVAARVGLTNGTNGGATPIADGSLIGTSGTVFGNAFDTSMRITAVVPEPASMALMGLGGLLMLRRRRSA